MQRALVVIILASVLRPDIAFGYYYNYLPLSDTELARRAPQRVLHRFFRHGMTARLGSITIEISEDDDRIRFSGLDARHNPWSVVAAAMLGGGLYSADLDRNGRADLIYVSYTGGNGLAPSMHVLTVMFDNAGRPIPCQMDGYFGIDRWGLRDLVDLDGDGRAELIRQSFDDGYWITSLYEAVNGHWRLIRGQHASRVFPSYTRFTYRGNRIVTTPAPGRNPLEDDLSNDRVTRSGTITGVRWERRQLQISSGALCAAELWYSTAFVVKDSPEGRSAASIWADEEAGALLQEMAQRNLIVELKGWRRDRASLRPSMDRCTPETIWATVR